MSFSVRPSVHLTAPGDPETRYREAQDLANRGEFDQARVILSVLSTSDIAPSLQALVQNDLATLAAIAGDRTAALAGFRAALMLDPGCEHARRNLAVLGETQSTPAEPRPLTQPSQSVRVAVISLLFNWPSTGGGNVHTAELTKFLSGAGYDVRHFYARYDPWGIGRITESPPHPAEAIPFTDANWTAADIVSQFRSAIDRFDPDWVLLTDSWNLKPLLAEAAGGRPYILRLQALECLCPLNNVRLLPAPDGKSRQCTRHQLATPDTCARCIREMEHTSGQLHRAERTLASVGTPEYRERLFKAFADAATVLVVNPLTAAMIEPYTKDVRVVTAGMDPARFPQPTPNAQDKPSNSGRRRVLFAGLTHEWMKGFHVLRAACDRLWSIRQDFEVVVTDTPPDGGTEPWARYIGWQSQADLPQHMAGADVVVVPTVAQEALGRTAVEAMASGRPVVASRLGGLPFTVTDGLTGFLCEPNDPIDLAAKLTLLLDDPELREQFGKAGRKRFEEYYTWPAIIERHYRPLLHPTNQRRVAPAADSPNDKQTAPTVRASVAVGCVLAIRNRPAKLLERTLQTYRWQSVSPCDQVLLDYGSAPEYAGIYRELCNRYRWRLIRFEPPEPLWHLADAYNRAVAALSPGVEVIFKSDADVLLSPEVLATAGRVGRNSFCQFQFIDLPMQVRYPPELKAPSDLHEVVRVAGGGDARLGDGLFACPIEWFRRVGGFDLAFRSWGYEDSDLRVRASRSLPMTAIEWHTAPLMHQWHPPAPDAGGVENRAYYKQMQATGEVVRNSGQLVPATAQRENLAIPPVATPLHQRVVVATRSMSAELFQLSGQFLTSDGNQSLKRIRVTGADALEYFRQLTVLDADWVINLDEDAFVLNTEAIFALINKMENEGYAACGMPDGGVVSIRYHNPVACNAFFNVFDLRRCRQAWAEWERVRALRHRAEYESQVAPFTRRTPFAFDDFEPYYGVFFALLEAGERILYLAGETWRDGVTTLVQGPTGQPLLLHAWYARDWANNLAIRQRYERVITHVRQSWVAPSSAAPSPPSPETMTAALPKTLVGLVVYDRIYNAERWLKAWQQSIHGDAKLAVIHNQDRADPASARAILDCKPDVYLPRENVGYDIGAFQDLVQGRFDPLLPNWEYLLWCTDDFIPVSPDFLLRFLAKAADPRVGLVAGRFGYWPGHWSGRQSERHCRTVGFLIRREIARSLQFPATKVISREHCLQFEHRSGHLMEQVLARGYRVTDIEDPEARIIWDTGHERDLDRWSLFTHSFNIPVSSPG